MIVNKQNTLTLHTRLPTLTWPSLSPSPLCSLIKFQFSVLLIKQQVFQLLPAKPYLPFFCLSLLTIISQPNLNHSTKNSSNLFSYNLTHQHPSKIIKSLPPKKVLKPTILIMYSLLILA
jgi:hypothetical protein